MVGSENYNCLLLLFFCFFFTDVPIINDSIQVSISENGTIMLFLDPIVTAASYHYSITVSSQDSTYTNSTNQTEFSIADSLADIACGGLELRVKGVTEVGEGPEVIQPVTSLAQGTLVPCTHATIA